MRYLADLNEDNQEILGKCFYIRLPSPELSEKNEAIKQKMRDLDYNAPVQKGKRLRLFAILLLSVVLFVGIRFLAGAEGNGKILFGVFLVLWLFAVVLLLFLWMKHPLGKEQKAFLSVQDAYVSLKNELGKQLSVPDDAEEMDVLFMDAAMAAYAKEEGDTSLPVGFLSMVVSAFAEENTLCFYDGDGVIGIRKEEILSLAPVKRSAYVQYMGKDLREVAEAAMSAGGEKQGEGVLFPTVLALTVSHEGEEWALLFPPYEEERLKTLLSSIQK